MDSLRRARVRKLSDDDSVHEYCGTGRPLDSDRWVQDKANELADRLRRSPHAELARIAEIAEAIGEAAANPDRVRPLECARRMPATSPWTELAVAAPDRGLLHDRTGRTVEAAHRTVPRVAATGPEHNASHVAIRQAKAIRRRATLPRAAHDAGRRGPTGYELRVLLHVVQAADRRDVLAATSLVSAWRRRHACSTPACRSPTSHRAWAISTPSTSRARSRDSRDERPSSTPRDRLHRNAPDNSPPTP